MAGYKILDFDISGMNCGSCSSLIETTLSTLNYVYEVNVNWVTKRAIVVVKDDITPQIIISKIEEADNKFKAVYRSPEFEKTYYFRIKGMNDADDVRKIKEKLEEQSEGKESLNSVEINYSTNVALITAYAPDAARSKKVAAEIKATIESAIKNKPLVATRFMPKIKEEVSNQDGSHYRRRAIINALVGIPLFLLSGLVPLPLTLSGQLIGLFIGGITFGVMWQTGKEFYKGAWDKFYHQRSSDMNTLIALGTSSAFFYSMLIVVVPWLFPLAALQYHFVAINMILGIVNLGKGLRANAEQQTRSKVQKLAQVYVKLQPQHGRVLNLPYKEGMTINNSMFVEKHYLQIKKGDIVEVLKEKRVPVEGVIISNTKTTVDEETLTGEPSNTKGKGDEVSSGTLNKKNTILIRATKDGKDGHLTRIIQDVNKSSATKPPISKLVDRLAVVFVPVIVAIAGVSVLGWYFLGPAPVLPWMIKSGMSVLLCACPCALGLATPISTAIGIYKQLHKKILVHDASALEVASQVNTVVIDKTGTLTHSVVHDVAVVPQMPDWTKEKVIQYAASLERSFDHPIARSFVNENSSHDMLYCEGAEKDEEGVYGIVNGLNVLVGSAQHLKRHNVIVPDDCLAQELINEKEAMSSEYVAVEKNCIATVACKHKIRTDAKKLIDGLKARDIKVIMLTGDQKEPAKAVAHMLEINLCVYKKSSKEKAEYIEKLIKEGNIVAMVGDGVNDIDAMGKAHLGIAVGSWTHASSVAKVATQQLDFIPFLIMAKETMNNIHQNLYWTGFYNLLSLTAATGLLYYAFGFVLNPIVASLLMAFSSFSVVINSMRLAHNIDYAMNLYEGKIQPPRNMFEKLKQYIPFQGLVDVLLSAVSIKKTEDKVAVGTDGAQALPQPLQRIPSINTPLKKRSPPSSPQKGNKEPIVVEDTKIKQEPATHVPSFVL